MLHARNIVHADIKPKNVMVAGGRALVIDFGYSRFVVGAILLLYLGEALRWNVWCTHVPECRELRFQEFRAVRAGGSLVRLKTALRVRAVLWLKV